MVNINWGDHKRRLFKSLHWIIVGLTIFVLVCLIVGSVVLFTAGVVQKGYPNVGGNFPSSTVEHYAFNKLDTVCSNTTFGGHFPIRLKYNKTDPNDPYRWEYCGWATPITVWRCFISLVTFIVCWVLIGILGQRTPASDSAGIWQNPRRVLKFLMVPVLIMLVLWFLTVIADGHSVQSAASFCYGKESSNPEGFICDMTMFVMVVLVDVAMVLLSVGLLGLIIIRKKKIFERYMQLDEEDDLPISMKRTSKSSGAKKGSKFSKFTRK